MRDDSRHLILDRVQDMDVMDSGRGWPYAVKALYDFLWTFGYLEPEYSLKLDGKDLSHLSPGERGTLLLVFYLLVDKSNKPIIVDSPKRTSTARRSTACLYRSSRTSRSAARSSW
jgi:hypothetical protein